MNFGQLTQMSTLLHRPVELPLLESPTRPPTWTQISHQRVSLSVQAPHRRRLPQRGGRVTSRAPEAVRRKPGPRGRRRIPPEYAVPGPTEAHGGIS